MHEAHHQPTGLHDDQGAVALVHSASFLDDEACCGKPTGLRCEEHMFAKESWLDPSAVLIHNAHVLFLDYQEVRVSISSSRHLAQWEERASIEHY